MGHGRKISVAWLRRQHALLRPHGCAELARFLAEVLEDLEKRGRCIIKVPKGDTTKVRRGYHPPTRTGE